MTINEGRASEGLPAVPSGDTPLASKDLMPVSTILAGGTDTR